MLNALTRLARSPLKKEITIVHTDPDRLAADARKLSSARVIFGFVSPTCDMARVHRTLSEAAPEATLMLSLSAGTLLSQTDQPLYLSAESQSIVLQGWHNDLVDSLHVVRVPLHCEDIKSGQPRLSLDERVTRIRQEVERIRVPFEMDHTDTVAITLVDGLSNSENFLMRAIYDSRRFPIMFVGGSSGGPLDFSYTCLADRQGVFENHALIGFVKLKKPYRYSVFGI
ncbi:FIST N-terminal domain-containing protein [Larsenimonas suaedae]|uniref:FIST N-terminal domain-containing protein n=1 Tax=Larsenimonas suaedae TaxID=1851019 RepID=A0ABU1GYK9_9GAMM|nr:FIST N-terminal domain-containing protein [Larsenimonas suaedae]MCM2973095.1 hypothetical protein [Larsenimonas suaedae]MDR5896532.1 FIST N-terminal domain-containing protein [Larsenimonas suaedae]